jgi:SAM-dependent methyltransferase
MECNLEHSRCPVCGSKKFRNSKVLWPELIEDWELNAEEAAYVDRQQGFSCGSCGNNLRSMVLAKAILSRLGETEPMKVVARRFRYRNLRILEINEAGNLTPFLKLFPRHQLVTYPESDMTKLDFSDETWDLLIHSETLEHVPEPLVGLKECRRILRKGGACIFTIPIIVGRMTRSREGLKDSYHGDPKNASPDYKVVTEFGADAWAFAISAGFDSCRIHVMDYPAGIAIEAIK